MSKDLAQWREPVSVFSESYPSIPHGSCSVCSLFFLILDFVNIGVVSWGLVAYTCDPSTQEEAEARRP